MSLDPDEKEDQDRFWDISFEEMGYYDYPAMINYALAVTNEKNLVFIAHSQGSTAMFYSLTTDRLKYLKEKISIFIALGPVTRLKSSNAEIL